MARLDASYNVSLVTLILRTIIIYPEQSIDLCFTGILNDANKGLFDDGFQLDFTATYLDLFPLLPAQQFFEGEQWR